MTPQQRTLRLYGQESGHPELTWESVEQKLTAAGLYWVQANTPGHPHPRPVWGVWLDEVLHLSLGSPTIRGGLAADPRITVHLESATDVVIVEGHALVDRPTTPQVLDGYRDKYDWDYDAAAYGDLVQLVPDRVLAWETAGWAGRESFQRTARWDFSAGGG